jgi:heat shock protein HslJ
VHLWYCNRYLGNGIETQFRITMGDLGSTARGMRNIIMEQWWRADGPLNYD